MKKIHTKFLKFTFLFIIVITFMSNFSFADNNVTVFVNGNKLNTDVNPVIENKRTLVPFRAIFESLGASVDWDSGTESVLATKDSTNMMLSIGSKSISINGKVEKMDVAPKIIKSRTMVPVRFVSEYMGAKVNWDAANNKVIITTDSESLDPLFDNTTINPGKAVSSSNEVTTNNINIAGTYAMQDINKNRYVMNFKSDNTFEMKNVVDGKKTNGTYNISLNNVAIVSPLINSTFSYESLNYKNKTIILMKDSSNSKTFAMTPISTSEYDMIIPK